MDREKRAKAKRVLLGVSLAWLVLGGWLAFFGLPADELQTINSPEVKDRMRDECLGSFRERYQCKEGIVLEVGQDAFANLVLRLVLVVSVPLMAAAAYHTLCRPDPIHRLPSLDDEPLFKPVHHPAAAHRAPPVVLQPKAEELPPHSPSPPNDDWKRRAQERTAHARPPGPLDKPADES